MDSPPQDAQTDEERLPHHLDQWLVNGSQAFGWISGDTHPAIAEDTPIYLFHGNRRDYGAAHIEKHKNFWKRYATSAPAWVWLKCQQSGRIFITSEQDRKIKLHLSLSPSALLVLEYREEHCCFSVVSLHPKPSFNDGTIVGRYCAKKVIGLPKFTIKPYIEAKCEVVVKHARLLNTAATSGAEAASAREPNMVGTVHSKGTLRLNRSAK